MTIFVGSMKQEAPCFGKALNNHKGRRKEMGIRKKILASGRYNSRRCNGFKLKGIIRVGGSYYKALKGIDGCYYVGDDGHLIGYNALEDSFTEIPIRGEGTSVNLYLHPGCEALGEGSLKGVTRYYRLDYLVATAWLCNPNGYRYVEHKDRNPFNFYRKNLKWVKERPVVHKDEAPLGIRQSSYGVFLGSYKSVREVSLKFGIPIYKVLNYVNTGKKWGSGYRLSWMWPENRPKKREYKLWNQNIKND